MGRQVGAGLESVGIQELVVRMRPQGKRSPFERLRHGLGRGGETSISLTCCMAGGVWSGGWGPGARTYWAWAWRFNAKKPTSNVRIRSAGIFLETRKNRFPGFHDQGLPVRVYERAGNRERFNDAPDRRPIRSNDAGNLPRLFPRAGFSRRWPAILKHPGRNWSAAPWRHTDKTPRHLPKFKVAVRFEDPLDHFNDLPGGHVPGIGHVINSDRRLFFPEIQTGPDKIFEVGERIHAIENPRIMLQSPEEIARLAAFVERHARDARYKPRPERGWLLRRAPWCRCKNCRGHGGRQNWVRPIRYSRRYFPGCSANKRRSSTPSTFWVFPLRINLAPR